MTAAAIALPAPIAGALLAKLEENRLVYSAHRGLHAALPAEMIAGLRDALRAGLAPAPLPAPPAVPLPAPPARKPVTFASTTHEAAAMAWPAPQVPVKAVLSAAERQIGLGRLPSDPAALALILGRKSCPEWLAALQGIRGGGPRILKAARILRDLAKPPTPVAEPTPLVSPPAVPAPDPAPTTSPAAPIAAAAERAWPGAWAPKPVLEAVETMIDAGEIAADEATIADLLARRTSDEWLAALRGLVGGIQRRAEALRLLRAAIAPVEAPPAPPAPKSAPRPAPAPRPRRPLIPLPTEDRAVPPAPAKPRTAPIGLMERRMAAINADLAFLRGEKGFSVTRLGSIELKYAVSGWGGSFDPDQLRDLASRHGFRPGETL